MAPLAATTIRLHRSGAGQGVILLHGLGATHGMWDGLAGLPDRFQLLTYDLPGHGETAPPEARYEIEDLSDQLDTVMLAAGIARAHLVGTSLGGMIALHFAAMRAERVSRLVLCDTSPALSEGTREALLTAPESGFAHAAMARADLMELAEEISMPTLVLCAAGADLGMRDGADFLARSIPNGQLAFVPGAVSDAVIERPAWMTRVLLDFLG